MEKALNREGYREVIISDVEDMNSMLHLSDLRMGYCRSKAGWAEFVYKPYKCVSSFSLIDDVEAGTEVEKINHDKAMNKGRGFYTSYLSPLCKDVVLDAEEWTVKGAYMYPEKGMVLPTDGVPQKNVYAYDRNKAYLSILLSGDYPAVLEGDLGAGIVNDGEIGFIAHNKTIAGVVLKGEWATVRFRKAHDKRLCEFANRIANQINDCKVSGDKETEKILKSAINIMIGITRNHNPWFYEWIVGSCSRFMEDLIDENTLICNTDSIISLTPRPDLDIGNKVGQFKVEYEGMNFIHRGTNYAWFDSEWKPLSLKQKGVLKDLQDPDAFLRGQMSQKMKYKLINNNNRGGSIKWEQ